MQRAVAEQFQALRGPGGPVWMGVLNLTPDSFSDGGVLVHDGGVDVAAAVAAGVALCRAGAGILDLGPEASSFFRPGVVPVGAAEQWARVGPVLAERAAWPGVLLSIDTRSAAVARAAVAAGAHIINDISAGVDDPAMLATAAELECGLILMHRGASFPDNPSADDPQITARVAEELQQRVAAAVAAGVRREYIWLDPGIGFGKTMGDNARLVMEIGELVALGYPVVLGISRKRFLAQVVCPPPPAWWPGDAHERDWATWWLTQGAVARGVRVHRVHRVFGEGK